MEERLLLVVFFSVLVEVHVASSLSLSRIWLSRSTLKTGALGDDETPLRLTASQTATTGGVMVSGIMNALDIAPTLHFVEPAWKINGRLALLSKAAFSSSTDMASRIVPLKDIAQNTSLTRI